MKQELRTRKYAPNTSITGRIARSIPKRPGRATVPGFSESVSEAQAVPEMTPEEWAADQERRKVILAGLIAKAQARVPGPANSPARQAYRDSPIDKIIVEKFRRQGFNL